MNINFITSFLFLITALYSYHKNIISICIACSLCLISSIIYHGCLYYNTSTNNPITNTSNNTPINPNIMQYIRIIDMIICNLSAVMFILVSFGFNIWYMYGLLCAYYNYVIYYECGLSFCPKYGEYWHSTLHLMGNIGIICMIESFLIS